MSLVKKMSWSQGAVLFAATWALVMAGCPAPAMAAGSHALSATFGSELQLGARPYPLSGPVDVEIDQTSRDIYVTDPGNHRVEKFDSAGNFLLMFGKEVNKTAVENGRPAEANVCPAASHPGDVCQTGVSASSAGAFVSPTYLAIDNSGGLPAEMSMSPIPATASSPSSTRAARSF